MDKIKSPVAWPKDRPPLWHEIKPGMLFIPTKRGEEADYAAVVTVEPCGGLAWRVRRLNDGEWDTLAPGQVEDGYMRFAGYVEAPVVEPAAEAKPGYPVVFGPPKGSGTVFLVIATRKKAGTDCWACSMVSTCV